MAYTFFNENTPDASTQSITEICDSTRENLAALRDAIITTGLVYGWDSESQDTGEVTPPADPTKSDQIMYDKGTERVRVSMTWTGDLVTVMLLEYSDNAGTDWDAIGTVTITYDGSDNFFPKSWLGGLPPTDFLHLGFDFGDRADW